MVATVRCAPPDNKPTPHERDTCAPWLHTELRLLAPPVRVVVALGGLRLGAAPSPALAGCGLRRAAAAAEVRPRRRGALSGDVTLLGCYHPSQHNTFTGRLTPAMLDAVFRRARALAADPGPGPDRMAP